MAQKSVLKRFKVTTTGKILRRISGQSHSLAKKSSLQTRRKKNFHSLYLGQKIVNKYL